MKKIIRISCITVLIILAVLTFVSRTVYNRNLPRVSVTVASAGFVPLTNTRDVLVTVPNTWRVTEVLAREGAEVERGDTLFLFDRRAHDLDRHGVELEILRLEDAVDAGDERAPAELEHARQRLAYIISTTPPENGLPAPISGRIIQLDENTHTLVIRNESVAQGRTQSFVVPAGAVFSTGFDSYVIYEINSRSGFFGPEDFVTAVPVSILRDNGVLVSVEARIRYDEDRMAEMKIAYDISGWVNSGDTVWVRSVSENF
ncbi:MAG: hypothetical protein FWE90_12550 [Defluviitaleaceae bacterium]|nr:hypothetical protein [Defluviitaleaceae bacterium]